MGIRTYIPQLGRYLQTDPIPGGSANAYAYVYADPVNTTDLTGERTGKGLSAWAMKTASEISQNQAIAYETTLREEAERKAREAAETASIYAATQNTSPEGEYNEEEGPEEEWWEEEGEGGWEYAAYHHGAGSAHEEARVEPGLLYQRLGESRSEDQAIREKTNLVVLCQSELKNHTEPSEYGACARYAHWYSGIEKDVVHIYHAVKHWLMSTPETDRLKTEIERPELSEEYDIGQDLDDWGFDDIEFDW
jgi:hypothetical protein